jgi:hypothetical protein
LITQSRPWLPASGQSSEADEGVAGGTGGWTGVGCGVGDVFPEQATAMLRPAMASALRQNDQIPTRFASWASTVTPECWESLAAR